ncbi:hypothetical protein ACFFMM_22980 [Micromonospora chaiyaphumensis]|uniref:Uncharacterized protein n=1 Tax=Micromonospora chaiyaphumensis TaxID=307119 RepID=A0A1C4Y8U2_9ACTN|nr:hypothetical protein [Micromonospora chaiyaphumensis]SCF17124.1 hypothetical protein GA0070214_107296 [Micromonospora chaiyaphumensis]
MSRSSRTRSGGRARADREAPPPAPAVERRIPWIILVLVLVLVLDGFSRHWVSRWTQDPSPAWAQTSLLGAGLLGLLGLLHALIGVQLLAAEVGEEPGSRLTLRAVAERAIGHTGLGTFVGTLLALFAADSLPAGLKLSSLVSDLATVGGILGLASLFPHHVLVTYRSLRRLRLARPGRWLRAQMTLGVVDTLILYKLLFLLPAALAAFS